MHHLTSSLSVGDCPVHQLRNEEFFLNRCAGQSSTESDDVRWCIDTIRPEDEQRTARNRKRILIKVLYINSEVCAPSWKLTKVKNLQVVLTLK
jgi:hypothetical protein